MLGIRHMQTPMDKSIKLKNSKIQYNHLVAAAGIKASNNTE
ncbi:MAG: hypothetical protein WC665_01295 [Sulfurimonas sp.]